MNPIAFLVEGFTSCNDATRFPEIMAAKKLAQENQCVVFDPIASFNVAHISEALKTADERTQKILILHIFLAFAGEGSSQGIIDQLIKEPYSFLVKQGFMKDIPGWVQKLDAKTIDDFAKTVLSTYFANDIAAFTAHTAPLKKELHLLSDQLSSRQFMTYLNENKEITTVYGLIGHLHLDMLNPYGKVIERQEKYAHIAINMGPRTVNVYLFGGLHGNMTHYHKMVDKIRTQDRLIIPDPAVTPQPGIGQLRLEDILAMLSTISPSPDPREQHHPAVTQQTDNSQLKLADLLATILSTISLSPDPREQHSPERYDSELSMPREKDVWPVERLADNFDWWMHNVIAGAQKDNDALMSFIYYQNRGYNIRDYDHFCEFANIVKGRGYKINLPPAKQSFEAAMRKLAKSPEPERSYHYHNPRASSSGSKNESQITRQGCEEAMRQLKEPQERERDHDQLKELADHFDWWMHNTEAREFEHNDALMKFIYCESIGDHLRGYAHFCEFANIVKERGYKINLPPAKQAFEVAMQKFKEKQERRRRR